MSNEIHLACTVTAEGSDWSSFAVLDLDPEIAHQLLSMRGVYEAAAAASGPVELAHLSVWDSRVHCCGSLGDDDLEQRLDDSAWVRVPDLHLDDDADIAGSEEGLEFPTEIDQAEVDSDGVRWKWYVGPNRIVTPAITWEKLEQLASGASPWELPDRCPRCQGTEISYGGGATAYCAACNYVGDQAEFEVA